MRYPIKVNEINNLIQFHSEAKSAHIKARTYLEEHPWCRNVIEGWLFTNLGYIVCIFLYKIENSQSPDDNLIWIVTGDFPSIYLDTYTVHATKEVIDTYIYLAYEWIEKVEANESTRECYPFDASKDKETAELFRKKVDQLKVNILNNIDDLNFELIYDN